MPFIRSRRSPAKKSSTRAAQTRRTPSRSARSPRAASQRQTKPTQIRPSLLSNLSPERRIDLIGVVIALFGLLIMLSIFSYNRGTTTNSWMDMLGIIFGWGVYILPFALLILGIWLIARNVERLPKLSPERAVGIVLLFINLLVILHGLAGPAAEATSIARAGIGGGFIGGIILHALYTGLDSGGTVILLLAWFLIALTMTLDLSVQELFERIRPLGRSLKQTWNEFRTSRTAVPKSPGTGADGVGAAQEMVQENFTPLTRPPVSSQAGSAPPGVTMRIGVPARPAIAWALPTPKNILEVGTTPAINEEYIKTRARLIEETLSSFGAPSQVVEISRGPTITMFGVEPNFVETRYGRTRVRVSKIVSLADDLALALAAPRIRIQAPVPGRSYVGIEVPNEEMTLVTLREVIESEVFPRLHSPLKLALGKDVAGHPLAADLTAMPHLLIAGTTGSGKSVCVNAILTCLLLHNTPDDLRLILVDPKRVELTGYNNIPHLLSPVVVEMERVVGAMQWMMREMDKRYHTFAQIGARNILDYNLRMKAQGGKSLPYLVVVIDELADLMMIAPDETERTITRIAQLARATGIHLIIATQRPSVDVVTGLIKANFPARIAFAVASGVDSRVILDQAGAERLLGRGDMLFQAPDAASPVRLQGVFVSDAEIQRLVEFWRQQISQSSAYAVPIGEGLPSVASDIPAAEDPILRGDPLKQTPLWEDMTPEEKEDPLLDESIDLIRREGRASVSLLQRKLRIGYTRAARMMDVMEEKGIVGPQEASSGARKILDFGPAAPPADE